MKFDQKKIFFSARFFLIVVVLRPVQLMIEGCVRSHLIRFIRQSGPLTLGPRLQMDNNEHQAKERGSEKFVLPRGSNPGP